MAGDDAPVLVGQPDFLGLGDEIADGQHQPVLADDDAAAFAQRAQCRRGEGIVGDRGAHGHDGAKSGSMVMPCSPSDAPSRTRGGFARTEVH